MKIRQGFVSNSSSSSFIIIGKELTIDKITNKMILEKNIVVIGDNLSTAQDVFIIRNIEELAFLKALNEVSNEYTFEIFETFVYKNNYNDVEFDAERLPRTGKIVVRNGEQDNSSSESLIDLQSRYDPYGQATKNMQKYLRAKKIKKIEENKFKN